MKKIFAYMMSACLLLTTVIGCGSSTENPAASTEQASSDSSENDGEQAPNSEGVQEITFWHYMTPDRDGLYLTKMIDQFNESQDRIKVNYQYIPREELMKQYTIGVVSGELPDCGMVDNPDHNSYASMGVFEDITELVNSWDGADFIEGPLNSCIYEDKIYGLPFGNNCLGLFYDVDAFEAVRIEKAPETWTELEAACEKLTQGTTKGLAISAIGDEEGTFQYMPWLLSAGGNVNEMDSSASKETATYLKNLVDKGYLSKECVNWTQADAQKQFSSGTAAMMVNGPWNIESIKIDSPDKNWAIAKIPHADNGQFASVLGGENIGICSGGNVEASWEFFQYLTNKENSTEMFVKMGRLSPRADVDGETMFKDDPNMAIFAELLKDAQPRGPHPKWPEISQAIYTSEQEILTGQKDIDASLKDAQTTIDKINQK